MIKAEFKRNLPDVNAIFQRFFDYGTEVDTCLPHHCQCLSCSGRRVSPPQFFTGSALIFAKSGAVWTQDIDSVHAATRIIINVVD